MIPPSFQSAHMPCQDKNIQLTKVVTTPLKVDRTRNTRFRSVRVKLGSLGVFEENLVTELKLGILAHHQFLCTFKYTNVSHT